jgi:hypothetical protein
MGFALIAAFSTPAQAVTGKWCFKWEVDYVDSGAGDYVLTDRPARYGHVFISNEVGCSPSVCDEYILDYNGCTATMTFAPNCTYHFTQLTRAQRGTRDVYVLADGYPWSSTIVEGVEHEFTTTSPPDSTPDPFLALATNDQFRIMPVVGNMLYFANPLAWEDGNDLKISFDPDTPTNCTSSFHHRESSTLSYICLEHSDRKFGAAHEMGHMIASINSAGFGGDYTGSQGMFRDPVDGTGGCDCPTTWTSTSATAPASAATATTSRRGSSWAGRRTRGGRSSSPRRRTTIPKT